MQLFAQSVFVTVLHLHLPHSLLPFATVFPISFLPQRYVDRKMDCNLHTGVYPPLTVAGFAAA